MAALPVCVARRRANPQLSYWGDGVPQLAMMLADPPGDPRSDGLAFAVDQVQVRWCTEPEASCLEWAGYRLLVGADGGDEFRSRCWTVERKLGSQ